MMMLPSLSLRGFLSSMERADRYPFYAILLYTPGNGLDARLHEYVLQNWPFLNSLTGDSCILFALEDIHEGPSIEAFKPEEVYDIARYLGASVADIPCVIFFTEPHTRKETVVLRLSEYLPETSAITNETLTRFFRELQSIVDLCSRASTQRLSCLREQLATTLIQKLEQANIATKSKTPDSAHKSAVSADQTVSTTLQAVLSTLAEVQKRDLASAAQVHPTSDSESRSERQSEPLDTTAPPAPLVVTLDFEPKGSGARIKWHSDLTGSTTTTFKPPYKKDELPVVIRALDVLQDPLYPNPQDDAQRLKFTFSTEEQKILSKYGLWEHDRVHPDAAKKVGYDIFKGLKSEGQGILRAVRNEGIAHGLKINYVLRFPQDSIFLAALPWELLWDQSKNQPILIRGNQVDSCERYIDLDEAIASSLPRGEKLDLLALSPIYGIHELVRQREKEVRLKTWDKLKHEGKINHKQVTPLTMEALNNYRLKARRSPDVIHYYGHGTYENGKAVLAFDAPEGSKEQVEKIASEKLATALGDVRLIVLHACKSAMVDESGSLLTGVAPALSLVSGAVVAMQLDVSINTGLRFLEVFYDQLLDECVSLQEAVARTRQVLFSENHPGWYVPTLYIRSRETRPVYLCTDRTTKPREEPSQAVVNSLKILGVLMNAGGSMNQNKLKERVALPDADFQQAVDFLFTKGHLNAINELWLPTSKGQEFWRQNK